MKENCDTRQNCKSDIFRESKTIAKYLNSNRSQIVNLLLSYESLETAQDEINRSIKALRAIKREMKYLCNSGVNYISSFFPINLPLYSLVLFGIIPSFIAKKIYIRPSELA